RQMADLIRQGKVYVAQPPLYKIKKKGVAERYILNDAVFKKEMLELGLDGAKLVAVGPPERGLDGKRLNRLVELVGELEKHGKEVRKKGVQFDKYLPQRRPADGLLPYARVFDPKRKQTVGVYKEEELKQWIADLKVKKPDLKIWEDTDRLEDRETADVEVT